MEGRRVLLVDQGGEAAQHLGERALSRRTTFKSPSVMVAVGTASAPPSARLMAFLRVAKQGEEVGRMFCDRNSLQAGLLALATLSGIADAPASAAEIGPGESVAVRPDPEGRATRVSVGIYINDISEIDDTKRTFTADVYVLLH